MPNHLERLGKNIVRSREKKGLTQVEFAAQVGVKQGTVSAWEKGKIDIPYSTLCKIAERLKTSPASLVDATAPTAASPDLLRLKCIEEIFRASPEQLAAIRAVLFADEHELISISAACIPVEKRLAELNQSKSTG